jgi:carboxypeptidase family protein
MRYLYVMIVSMLVIGCGGSDFDNAPVGQQSSGTVPSQQFLPVVLQANGGLFSPNGGGEITVTFSDIESRLLVGTNGEGGTVPAREFLAAQGLSRENSRTAELSYRVGSDTRLIPLEIIDITFQDDNTATVTAIIPTIAQESDINAQTLTGSIRVTVRDNQGESLPGVVVTATSPILTGSRTTVTDANGTSFLRGLPPGEYEVQAQLEGFKTGVTEVGVRIGQTTPVNMTLELSTVEEPFDSAELVINPPN